MPGYNYNKFIRSLQVSAAKALLIDFPIFFIDELFSSKPLSDKFINRTSVAGATYLIRDFIRIETENNMLIVTGSEDAAKYTSAIVAGAIGGVFKYHFTNQTVWVGAFNNIVYEVYNAINPSLEADEQANMLDLLEVLDMSDIAILYTANVLNTAVLSIVDTSNRVTVVTETTDAVLQNFSNPKPGNYSDTAYDGFKCGIKIVGAGYLLHDNFKGLVNLNIATGVVIARVGYMGYNPVVNAIAKVGHVAYDLKNMINNIIDNMIKDANYGENMALYRAHPTELTVCDARHYVINDICLSGEVIYTKTSYTGIIEE